MNAPAGLPQPRPAPGEPDASGPTAAHPTINPPQRHDGWLPERQRLFLSAIAEGYTVAEACRLVGLSTASAYAFRQRPSGRAFALGWQAARLIARDHLADTLMARAIDGQTDTYTRADGTEVTRHRHDNRLALALLTRLDRLAAADPADGAAADIAGGLPAARLVAQDFEGFLDLVECGGGTAQAGLFLAARAEAADEAEAYRQLRQLRQSEAAASAARAARIAAEQAAQEEQRLRQAAQAEAQGEEEEEEDDDLPAVWWNDDEEGWRTDFPPPEGWRGTEWGRYGDEDYYRVLTDAEEAAAEARHAAGLAERRARESDLRDAWFGFTPEEAEAIAPSSLIPRSGSDDAAPSPPDPPAGAARRGPSVLMLSPGNAMGHRFAAPGVIEPALAHAMLAAHIQGEHA